jgi:TetR/AcrR family transcriptional regulator, tetracycline repressor protein
VTSSRLDESSIVRAALALADEQGFAVLSMRTLASRLGVKAASLYYHVPSRDALEQLIADSIAMPVIDAGHACIDAPDLLRTVARTLRSSLREHPGAAVVVATRQISAHLFEAAIPGILTAMQSGLAISDEDALYLIQSLYVLVTGLALAEFGDGPAAPAAPAAYYDAWFETSLETFIAGLESRFTARS